MARYIKYVGLSHVREILDTEWAALDPPVENDTLRWDRANGWTIPADRVSEDAWPYIEADNELVLIDRDYRGLADADSANADAELFPPLMTAEQAEAFTPTTDESTADEEVEERPADQSTGSVSVDDE